MFQKIYGLIRAHYDVIVYLFFGVLTTAVNYAVYLPCLNLFGFSAAWSNVIAWIAAVIFAYLTNKPFVFHSKDWSSGTIIPEFTKFLGCRVGSGLLETAIIWLMVDVLTFNGNLVKILVSVLVVILNYVASKWLVFAKGRDAESH